MPDLSDYIEGGEKAGAAPSEVLGRHERHNGPFKVGDRVRVTEIPGVESETLPQVVTVTHANVEANDYRATFDSGEDWYFNTGNGTLEIPVSESWPQVGDLVKVDEICDVYEKGNFPQIVEIKQIDYDAGIASCGHDHRLLAEFAEMDFCFSVEECEKWDGPEPECVPWSLAEDGEIEEAQSGWRPLVGEVVKVNSIDGDMHYRDFLPAVVEINRDDHDSQPFRADFPDGESYYFTESDCEPITLAPRHAEIPYSLDEWNEIEHLHDHEVNDDYENEDDEDDEPEEEGEASEIIAGFEIGDKVIVTEADQRLGEQGTIYQFDHDDPRLPFLVEFNDTERWWCRRVEKVEEAEKPDTADLTNQILTDILAIAQAKDKAWRTFEKAAHDVAGVTMIDLLVDETLAKPADVIVQINDNKIVAIKILRWWAQDVARKSINLQQAKDVIEAALVRSRS